jgi:hypothetical protein
MPGIIQKRKGTADGAGAQPDPTARPCEGAAGRPVPLLVGFFLGWLCGALARSIGGGGSRREW